VVNEDFNPTENQTAILRVFEQYYQTSPGQIQEFTNLKKQRVNDALGSLVDAGWVKKPSRGLYQLVYNGDCYVEIDVRCVDENTDVR
jgi:hypothetical protein